MTHERAPADVVRPLRRVRQVRHFTEQAVDRAVLDALLGVARWSGSSRNSQPWRFILVQDRSTIQKLHAAGVPQTRALETATAAIAIVLPDEPERQISRAYDDGRAAERILIAASMLDIGAGISWIRADVLDEARAMLGLPETWLLRTIMAIGHPTAAARQPKSPRGEARRPAAEMIREERWSE